MKLRSGTSGYSDDEWTGPFYPEKISFGSTGQESSRTIFGAAALARMKPERAERVLAI